MNFKNKEEAEKTKEAVKEHLVEYLELKGITIKNNSFRCFNGSAHKNGDKNPSAGLTKDKQAFECHACGLKGDIFTACNAIEGKSINGREFYNTVAYLADKFNIKYETYTGEASGRKKPDMKKVAEYPYHDEHGVLQYKTIRYEWIENGKKRKAVTPCHLSKKTGAFISGFDGVNRILYKLPDVKKAIKNNDLIFLVEGEKCADIICELGFTGTAIPGGSNAWKKPHTINYIQQLANADIIILPDNDHPGNKFAETVSQDIYGITSSLKIIRLTNDIELPQGGDIEEYLQLGGSKESLLELVNNTKEWKPGAVTGDLPEWYETTKTGKVKVNSGLLSRHLIDTVPAVNVAGNFYLYNNGVYTATSNKEHESIVKKHIEDRYVSMNIIADAAGLWATDEKVKIDIEKINSDPYILNLKNGLFNIRTGELKPHTNNHFSTIQLNVNYNSTSNGSNFITFIKNALKNNPDAIALVQELTGYLFTTFTQAKKFFVLKGSTNTGKSTYLNAVQNIISEQYLSHVPLQNLNDRFNKAQLFGKLANIVNELPDQSITDAGFLKALVGQDPLQGERKGKDPFNFTSKAKHVFACNNIPSNYGDRTDGFYKKLIIIPFENQVQENEIDPYLPEKLKSESDFIFKWGLEGLNRLIKNNFVFTELEESKELLEKYKIMSNSVLAFVNDRCMFHDEIEVTSTELYAAYKEYCEDDNLKAVSKNKFRDEIETNFKSKIRKALVTSRRLSGFKGIGITTELTEEEFNAFNNKNNLKEVVI